MKIFLKYSDLTPTGMYELTQSISYSTSLRNSRWFPMVHIQKLHLDVIHGVSLQQVPYKAGSKGIA